MVQGADGGSLGNHGRRQGGPFAGHEGQVQAARRGGVQADKTAVAEGRLLAQGGQAPPADEAHGGVEVADLQDNEFTGVVLATGPQAQGGVGQNEDSGGDPIDQALPGRLPAQEDAIAGGGVLHVVHRDDHMVQAEDHRR